MKNGRKINFEYAEVYGNYYGTPREYVEEKIASGFDVLLEIDIQGALQVDKYPTGFLYLLSHHLWTNSREGLSSVVPRAPKQFTQDFKVRIMN